MGGIWSYLTCGSTRGSTAPSTSLSPQYGITDPSTSLSPQVITAPSTSSSGIEGAKFTSNIDKQIEQSKSHWSEVVQSNKDEKMSNQEVFKDLQKHPEWGGFFHLFEKGELEIGKKFAEGGQAELYELKITWNDQNRRRYYLENPCAWVLKVYKLDGMCLQDLQSWWPKGMLRIYPKKVDRADHGEPQPLRYFCDIYRATLLSNDRFGFVMVREHTDLRTLIDCFMSTNRTHPGPFSVEDAEMMMYRVAAGMKWLHDHEIVHRDLKASNVLCTKGRRGWSAYVADFECSMGVVGTGFFRAPEILKAYKEWDKERDKPSPAISDPELFSKTADVYSYGMTCYEILTGKFPFQGLLLRNYIEGRVPEDVPNYVDKPWILDLLKACWRVTSTTRPSFGEILKIFLDNSTRCKNYEREKKKYEKEKGIRHAQDQ